jgi:hypothetical protein
MDNPQGNTVSEVRASTAHTPGPWKVTKCDDGLWMVHTDGDTVCFGDHNHKDPDDSANFRLIAAAPNLLQNTQTQLAQKERFLKILSPADKLGGWGLLLDAWIKEDRAAIAKATGTTDTHRDSVNEQRAGDP